MLKKNPYRYTDDIKGYKAAVWDFLLEHSEITPTGKIFVKFHTNDQKNFENRVLGRWKYNYHREDVQKKAEKANKQKAQYREEKARKKKAYKEAKKKRLLEFKKKDIPTPFKVLVEKV